ncbi:hypothetical protein A2685_00870 [Candidatus Woesebacteria bacterium RIFCSPHIGHO2_01_FULL_37_10]|uniref:Peptidase M50 domain-containing protein n=1 Tax=Candidatus Woesebacteria bacterium RIFCSPHIGHO2_01_FULL_37_10 TaxID=1802489 RepID=A0A1F7XTE0_9BACT|nr:MAG: hypothetical protein A2685_00870 [Candidatus Woesebacteria bacterium RIFCSPHIGHO2_01_FULL_37_10]
MNLIAWILAFIIAITIHEAAHAWMADKLGDPTARLMGRLSLNPLVHYDPVGTTLLLGLVFMRSLGLPVIPFGWAKPVRFDPFNLKNPRRDSAMISLAGPVSNLLLAALLSLILRLSLLPYSSFGLIFTLISPVITLNVVLAIFNLVPVHPLDGGKIFIGLLPRDQAEEADRFLTRYGMLILIFLIFPTFGGTSPLFSVIGPVINLVLKVLIPGNPLV